MRWAVTIVPRLFAAASMLIVYCILNQMNNLHILLFGKISLNTILLFLPVYFFLQTFRLFPCPRVFPRAFSPVLKSNYQYYCLLRLFSSISAEFAYRHHIGFDLHRLFVVWFLHCLVSCWQEWSDLTETLVKLPKYCNQATGAQVIETDKICTDNLC